MFLIVSGPTDSHGRKLPDEKFPRNSVMFKWKKWYCLPKAMISWHLYVFLITNEKNIHTWTLTHIRSLNSQNYNDFYTFQEIEQDRHSLKRRLVNAQTESDAKLLELQADVRDLQAAVSQRERQLRQTEKEKARLVSELTEQNHRLQTQIKEVLFCLLLSFINRNGLLLSGESFALQLSKAEHDLQAQCRQLQDQCSQKKWSLHDHQSSLDVLREEVSMFAQFWKKSYIIKSNYPWVGFDLAMK